MFIIEVQCVPWTDFFKINLSLVFVHTQDREFAQVATTVGFKFARLA
jgi:hypothetical protein